MADYPTIIDANGIEYRGLSADELKNSPDPKIAEFGKWVGGNRYYSDNAYYYSPELHALIKDNFTEEWQGAAACSFKGPRSDLTLEDFLVWAQARVKVEASRYAGYNLTRSYSRPAARYLNASWPVDAITERSPNLGTTHHNNYFSTDWHSSISAFLSDAWTLKKAKPLSLEGWDLDQAHVLLHYFTNGDVSKKGETFRDFLLRMRAEEESEAVRDARALRFPELPGWQDFAKYFGSRYMSKNVGSLHQGRQKRSIALLLDQDSAMWQAIVKEAPKYSKGTTHNNLEEFINEVELKLGRGAAPAYPVYSPSELKREFTLLIAEGVLFEGPYYSADKLHGLSSVALAAIPEERALTTYAKEYSHILHLVRTMIKNEKDDAELELILAEGDDQARIQEAAKSAGKLTLMQTVGLLMAAFYPRSWMRGTSTNGPYLLVDLLESEGLPVLQFLSEIILALSTAVPTETEWRKALGTIPMDAPAGIVISLIVSSTALAKPKRGYPEHVGYARKYFGLRS